MARRGGHGVVRSIASRNCSYHPIAASNWPFQLSFVAPRAAGRLLWESSQQDGQQTLGRNNDRYVTKGQEEKDRMNTDQFPGNLKDR
jgi:hypothetical protein